MITIANKPKNLRGVESQVWDVLIDASRENIIGTEHDTYTGIRQASMLITKNNLGKSVREAYNTVYREYNERLRRLSPQI